MRHTMLLVAVVVLCALGPPSWAYYNPFEGYGGANMSMQLENLDVGTTYFNLPDNDEDNPLGYYDYYDHDFLAGLTVLDEYDVSVTTPYKVLAAGAADNEDTWGIFRLTSIRQASKTWVPFGSAIWAAGEASAAGWEITAIVWGEQDRGIKVSDGGLTQLIWGDNMYAAFFANQPTAGDTWDDVWTLGPGARTTPNPEFQGITDSPGASYTKASGAKALWTFSTVYGDTTTLPYPDAEFVNTFHPSAPPGSISGSGGAYAIASEVPFWGTGEMNEVWQENPFKDLANPHSITLKFTSQGQYDDPSTPENESIPGSNWLVSSSDPIKGAITPELSSASLMLIGLFPLGLVAWKRRKQ